MNNMTSKCSHVMHIRFQLKKQNQNKPLKVTVCSLEGPHVVTSEPQNISWFLCMIRAVESMPYSALCFLESGCSDDQMCSSAKCSQCLVHIQISELIYIIFFCMAYVILTIFVKVLTKTDMEIRNDLF